LWWWVLRSFCWYEVGMCWSRESVEIEVAVEVDLGVINRVAYHIGRGACASPGKEMDRYVVMMGDSV